MIELPNERGEDSPMGGEFGDEASSANAVAQRKGKPRAVSSENVHEAYGATGRCFDLTIAMYDHRDSTERKQIGLIITNFAKGVYEMTEGKHVLRTVRIFENPGCMEADIHWKHHDLDANGQVIDRSWTDFKAGKSIAIHMYDDGLLSWAGGVTLAHEWGHYEYGFLDEYRERVKVEKNNNFAQPHTDDSAVYGSIMAGLDDVEFKKKCNLSYAHNKKLDDNQQGMWQARINTAQYRVFNQSCLEQLKNPVEPKSAKKKTPPSFKIPKWPEFSKLDPTKPPEIDLDKPGGEFESVYNLDIRWEDAQKQMVAICLDRSGSMQADQLANAKANTCRVIDTLQDGAMVEVLAFDSSVSTVFSFTELTSANRAGLKSQVNAIGSGDTTALWDAAEKGVEDMKSKDPDGRYVKSVLLMTDGGDNASSASRSSVVQQCQEVGVAFNSISYGSYADSQLAAASSATGGKNVSSSESLASLSGAFSRLGTHGTDRGAVVDSEGKVDNATWTEAFTVDSTATNLQATVTLSVPTTNATIVLEAPSGARYSAYSKVDVGDESSWVFKQAKPASGMWIVIVTAPTGTAVTCFVDTSAVTEPPQLLVWVDETNMVAYAAVSQGAPVDGARVRAVLNDNGTKREVAFTEVGGGTYLLDLSTCGAFQNGFTVRADAEQGVATYTYVNVMGSGDYDEGAPISESFTRSEWVALGKENAVTFYASGKGKLEFQWRTSGEGMPGRIDFLCNGSMTATLGSGQGWTKKEIVFDEEGAHLFQWGTPSEVRKFTGTWLRNVVWHPEPDVEMGDITVTPRWPWNGMVDIDFAFAPTLVGTKATFAVSGVDGDLGNTIAAKTLTGEYRNLAAGTHRVTWNLGADAPGFHSSAFTVQLDATVEPLPAPVVRIGRSTASGGNLLQWDGATPSATYTVFRGTNASGAGAAVIGTVQPGIEEEPSFLDSTAPNGRTVWYAVESSAWKIGGGRSTWVSARRPMLPPTKLAATDGTRTDGVSVTWTPSAGTVKSRVYRCASGASWQNNCFTWGNPIVETTNTSWFDSTVVPGAAYAYAVACVSAEREASSLPKLSSENGLFDLGWRNMKAPIFTSTMRTNWVEYGYAPWEQLHWYKNYWCYSKYSIAWNPVEGAQSYLVDHWCDDASAVSIVTNSVTVTECTFEYLDARSTPSSNRIWYRPPRTFRVTPIRDHQGLSTEVTVE